MAIEKDLLGKAIRQIRELRGISQATLAEQAGIRGNSVALVERGLRGVSMDTLNAIAEALNVPAACLTILGTSKIAGDGDSASLVKSMQKLIVATVSAQARLTAKEVAGETKPNRTAVKRKAAAQKKKPARRRASKRLAPA
jgi:transcriptional regulator with XRE-family HTH domain